MAEEREVEILGRLVPCPKVTMGQISLVECVACPFHKGIEHVKDEHNGFSVDDILCSMPIRKRIGYHIKGVI